MNPGFDVRLSSMKRALGTVIIPAIDPDNHLAQEQAALMLAHIGMLEAQWDKLDEYARLCVQDLVALTGRLAVAGGAETLAAATTLQSLAHRPSVRKEQAYRDLSGALEDLVRAVDRDGDRDFRRALHREVLLHGNRQAARDRVWFAACGFDVNTAELPSIEAMIGRGDG